MYSETFVIDSPIGSLAIEVNEFALTHIELNTNLPLKSPTSELAKEVTRQIGCYFNDSTFQFNIEMSANGTEYQKKVWHALENITVGEIISYGALADKVDSGARAIGNACRNNPIPLIVPCHRVVSASGLGGFSGKLDGRLIEIKQILLKHEKAILI